MGVWRAGGTLSCPQSRLCGTSRGSGGTAGFARFRPHHPLQVRSPHLQDRSAKYGAHKLGLYQLCPGLHLVLNLRFTASFHGIKSLKGWVRFFLHVPCRPLPARQAFHRQGRRVTGNWLEATLDNKAINAFYFKGKPVKSCQILISDQYFDSLFELNLQNMLNTTYFCYCLVH